MNATSTAARTMRAPTQPDLAAVKTRQRAFLNRDRNSQARDLLQRPRRRGGEAHA
jgi:hypothetical protein